VWDMSATTVLAVTMVYPLLILCPDDGGAIAYTSDGAVECVSGVLSQSSDLLGC
jgi:hypothetical protein